MPFFTRQVKKSKNIKIQKVKNMNQQAAIELLYKMADDALIIGHRNSEWTGTGPILEEDISFSSMAQDKIGHSWALYKILHEMGEKDPDSVAFGRNAEKFHNCQMVEYPIGEYDFSLVRHFLFDYAEWHRYNMLSNSSLNDLAMLARKIKGEIKYHILHAKTWMKNLGNSTGEAQKRLQSSLILLYPLALGIFEPSPFEDRLIADGIFRGEEELKLQWKKSIQDVLSETKLELDLEAEIEPVFGGRIGNHSEHLQPLLDEMAEVVRAEPGAEW
jgi:ring-1,2-phenylacetyl-CoA epoxidase subunit PaaC